MTSPIQHSARALALLACLVAPVRAQEPLAFEPYVEAVQGTLVTFRMIPVRGQSPFWMSETEVTWDLFDVFVYGLDQNASAPPGADAVSRPSKPYLLPGADFGHAGHPALAMSFHAAETFARWLSAKTGKRYRLPTEAEWRHACRLGETRAPLTARAWYADNSGARTQRVATRAPDALGLYDVLGNVAEWVRGDDGSPAVMGGAFNDVARNVHCAALRRPSDAWNMSDPQLPKSRWWLADAPFVGLRLVREPDGSP